MDDFTSVAEHADGLRVKLWRGERMCLIGMDVPQPEDDFVGFSIEVKNPFSAEYVSLRNRLHFSYDRPIEQSVTGSRDYNSTQAPFQKFRWIHFPKLPKAGKYAYRVTKQHMRRDGSLVAGSSTQADIVLDLTTYDDFLDVGFTRNFASSQAYADHYGNDSKIIPARSDESLTFQKESSEVYQWLGFEAYDLIFAFLNDAVADTSIELDLFAYDLNEPDIIALLEKVGPRLRAVLDNSGSHAAAGSAESRAAKRLAASAGHANVKRTHFRCLQHNKALIAKRNGKAFKVLLGSTNFSFRGIYVQANNVLVFHASEVAELFAAAFDAAFHAPGRFNRHAIANQWHLVNVGGKPRAHFCFSPHIFPDLALNPLIGAIDQATSSVFFSIAFLYQDRSATRQAIDRLMQRNIFSYGISDKRGRLRVNKPDGSTGLVDFAHLAANAPEPFKSEWSGGGGIHEHHKFVVTDFSLSTAKVFTGSSNLCSSGEKGNGDHLVMIEDSKVATAFAIEALRIFDHLHFRSKMQEAAHSAKTQRRRQHALRLRKPPSISGRAPWFAEYYKASSQEKNDRELFSR